MSAGAGQNMLRASLRGNAAFSTLSGVAFLAASAPLAEAIGLEYPVILMVVGAGLLLFAVGLVRNAARERISELEAVLAISGDFAWVVASGAIVLLGVLNTTGNWAVAGVADVVLVFAVLQWVGLRRVRRGRGAGAESV